MNALPGCLRMYFGDFGFGLTLLFASESAAHLWVNSGADWLSHSTMPSQNVGRSMKSHVPPFSFCWGSVAGFFGRRNV